MKFITLENWVSEYSEMLALETLKLIDAQRSSRGDGAADAVALQVIGNLVYLTVLGAMHAAADSTDSDKKRFAAACESLLDLKVGLQNEIAAGIAAAMKDFSGKDVEYYCQIKVVPEPLNKSSN